jgi:hypothetical protein
MPRSTEPILQAKSLNKEQTSILCRASMVKTHFGQVVEYPSECSAAPRTTLRPNSLRLNTLCLTASAEQRYSCPIQIPVVAMLMKSLQDFFWMRLTRMQLRLRYGIEYNKTLKPTVYACHAICGESKLRATLRRLSSTVLFS